MNGFFLTSKAVGDSPKTEINEDEFNKIKASRDSLWGSFSVERAYDIFIRNYYELERECISISLENVIYHKRNQYSSFLERLQSIDGRIINFLSTARMYRDQVPKYFETNFMKGEEICKSFKSKIEQEKKKNLSFLFIEEFRNHVQHNGFPLFSCAVSASWDDKMERLEYRSLFFSKKEELKEDEKFSKILSDVWGVVPEEIELLKEIRVYVGALSGIHESIRNEIKAEITDARACLQRCVDLYAKSIDGKYFGLSAQHFVEGEVVSSIPIILNWDDARIELEEKNRSIRNMDRIYVSSRLSENENGSCI